MPPPQHVASPRDYFNSIALQASHIMDSDVEDLAAEHYDDTNRAFLQAIMARGTVNLKEGKNILAAIFTAQDAQEGP